MGRLLGAFVGLIAVFAMTASPAVAQSYGQGGVPTVLLAVRRRWRLRGRKASPAPAAHHQLIPLRSRRHR